jgi:DNA polymerase II small subunit
LLEPDAMNHLLDHEDPMLHLKSIWKNLDQDNVILSISDIRKAEKIAQSALEPKPIDYIGIVQYESEFEVLKELSCSGCEGKIGDFTRYFKSRFAALKKLVRNRRELGNCINITKAKKLTGDVRFIGLVNSAVTTRNGHRMLELEDEGARIKALVMNDSRYINDPVTHDEVVGIVGKRFKDFVIVDEIVRPGHPINKSFRTADKPISAAFISDLHVGSKHFLYDEWKRFVDRLNTRNSIKYIVMAGDLIDGVGIYPKQEEDLQIEDIVSQYEELSGLIKGIPEHIKIVMVPGNHDAVRPAEPQPALPEEIRNLFGDNIVFTANPSSFRLSGVEVLAYHGRSIDDLVSQIPGTSYDRPLEVMKAVLQKRHLAPVYGGKTPISPEKEDYLVIDTIPDIFVTGHVHAIGVETYRGIKLINSSTWQAQTDYQRMRNITPDPCQVVVVNLGTGETSIESFLT